MPLRTLNDLLAGPVSEHPEPLREFVGGSRRAMSGKDLALRATRLGAALRGYGLAQGDRAAIVAPLGSEALIGLFAVMSCGGVAVPVDPELPDDTVAAVLRESRARQVLVDDEASLRRVVNLRSDLPGVELVLLFRPAESERPSPALLVDTACAVGEEALAEDPELLDRVLRRIEREEPAWIPNVAADGPLPEPRSHRQAAAAVEGAAAALGSSRGDVVLVHLESSDPDRTDVILGGIASLATVVLAPSGAGPRDALRAVGATVMVGSAAALESLGEEIEASVAARSWVGRSVAAWALARGRERSRRPWAHRVAETLALRDLREDLGGRLRAVLCASGAPPEGVAGHLEALGIVTAALDRSSLRRG